MTTTRTPAHPHPEDDTVPAQLEDTDTVDPTGGTQAEPGATPETPVASAPSAGSAEVPAPPAAAEPTAAAPAAAEPGAAAPAGPSAARRAGAWARRHGKALLAGLLVVALVVGLVLTTLALRRSQALEDARESALQAGKDAAVAIGSYDHTTLDRDFAAVTDRSTPAFRESFTETSAALRKVLEQYSASATSTVVAAGVTSASEDRAVVLVFLNQEARNTNQQAGPTTDQSRVEVTLVRPDGTWLIDAVKLL